MYSAAYLYQYHGLNKFADRAERVAFNAMPAQISEDWWSHQYIALPNQPWAKKTRGRPYTNVSNYGTVFGMEPNYVCSPLGSWRRLLMEIAMLHRKLCSGLPKVPGKQLGEVGQERAGARSALAVECRDLAGWK